MLELLLQLLEVLVHLLCLLVDNIFGSWLNVARLRLHHLFDAVLGIVHNLFDGLIGLLVDLVELVFEQVALLIDLLIDHLLLVVVRLDLLRLDLSLLNLLLLDLLFLFSLHDFIDVVLLAFFAAAANWSVDLRKFAIFDGRLILVIFFFVTSTATAATFGVFVVLSVNLLLCSFLDIFLLLLDLGLISGDLSLLSFNLCLLFGGNSISFGLVLGLLLIDDRIHGSFGFLALSYGLLFGLGCVSLNLSLRCGLLLLSLGLSIHFFGLCIRLLFSLCGHSFLLGFLSRLFRLDFRCFTLCLDFGLFLSSLRRLFSCFYINEIDI